MTTDARPTDAPAIPVQVWAIPGLVATLLAMVSALATPLMGLPDEPAHAVHAVAVVHGEVVGSDAVRTDDATGWTRTETEVAIPSAFAALPALPACFAFQPTVPATCAPDPATRAGPDAPAVSTVGTYAPPWYAIVGWPSLVLPPTAALVGMRLMAALVFGGLVAVAAAGAWRAGASRWGLVGLALALPPVAVHLAGGINPSGTEIAGAVALWTSSAALVHGAVERADLSRWVVAGVTVALVRPLGPVLAVAIPVAVVAVLGGTSGRRRPWLRDSRVRGAGAIVVLAAVLGMTWNLWRGTLSAFSGFPAPELSTWGVLRRSLGLVPERLVEMVGVLGWADVTLPRALTIGWLLLTSAVVVAGLRVAGRRPRAWLVLLGIGVLLLPLAADLRSASTIGFVWQGRYTLPVAAGLPLLAGLLLDRQAPGGRVVGPAVVVAALAGGHLVALAAVLRRFRVGSDGALVSALGAPGVHVAVPGWVLLAAATAVLVAAGVAWPRQPVRPPPRP